MEISVTFALILSFSVPAVFGRQCFVSEVVIGECYEDEKPQGCRETDYIVADTNFINKWCCVKAVYDKKGGENSLKALSATGENSFAAVSSVSASPEATDVSITMENSNEVSSENTEDSQPTTSPITSAQRTSKPLKSENIKVKNLATITTFPSSSEFKPKASSNDADRKKVMDVVTKDKATTKKTLPVTLPQKAMKKIIKKVRKAKTTQKFTEYYDDYEVDENGEKVDNLSTEAMKTDDDSH